jgi:hypothetical protein
MPSFIRTTSSKVKELKHEPGFHPWWIISIKKHAKNIPIAT